MSGAIVRATTVCIVLLAAVTVAQDDAVRRQLMPTGKLRVGLNYGNFLLVLKDKPDGTPQGIAPDLARELAKRLEMGLEFVKFDAAGKLADGPGSRRREDRHWRHERLHAGSQA